MVLRFVLFSRFWEVSRKLPRAPCSMLLMRYHSHTLHLYCGTDRMPYSVCLIYNTVQIMTAYQSVLKPGKVLLQLSLFFFFCHVVGKRLEKLRVSQSAKNSDIWWFVKRIAAVLQHSFLIVLVCAIKFLQACVLLNL